MVRLFSRPIAAACLFFGLAQQATGQPNVNRVEVKIDVPKGLSDYTALHPVTFGIPFPRNRFDSTTDRVRLVDSNANELQSQFELATLWPNTSDVKWLHVDTLVPITKGIPPKIFLEFGNGVPLPSPIPFPIKVTSNKGTHLIDTGVREFKIGPNSTSIGDFVLRKSLDGVTTDYSSAASSTVVEVEKQGPIRTTLVLKGHYKSATGVQASKFVTRLRFYSQSSHVQVDHTLLWTENDGSKIAALSFMPRSLPPLPKIRYGLDGSTITKSSFDLHQVNSNSVRGLTASGGASEVGNKIDGWIEVEAPGGTRKLHIGLRWPWQQFPTGFASSPNLTLGLIHPDSPLGLTGEDQAIGLLKDFKLGKWNIPENQGGFNADGRPRMSPLGLGKSYVIMYWDAVEALDPGMKLPPEVKNTLLQHPIYAFADPAFVAKAGHPNPLSPRDLSSFPEIEEALDASFDWVTQESVEDGDFGIWNFGDVQYEWSAIYGSESHRVLHRYWMNNGKGWSLVPWLLWMRSGERKYVENAEAHSRHVMDVDTCHMTETSEFKYLGGTYEYAPLHWGPDNSPAYMVNDSEYLIYAYHLLGIERARDVLYERVEGILAAHTDNKLVNDVDDLLAILSAPGEIKTPGSKLGSIVENNALFNREPYRVFGELCLLYEETNDPRLRDKALEFWSFLKASQASNGWLPGIKTNPWFDQSLNIAARALPQQSADIKELMKRWTDHQGMHSAPSSEWQMQGPSSLWSLVTLGKMTSDSKYLDAVEGYVQTEALTIHEDSALPFRGLSKKVISEIGPAMRDWVIAMGHLSSTGASAPKKFGPMPYFNGGLPNYTLCLERVDSIASLPIVGQSQIIVAEVGGGETPSIHIRIFDSEGQIVVDKPETHLFANELARLKKDVAAALDGTLAVNEDGIPDKDGNLPLLYSNPSSQRRVIRQNTAIVSGYTLFVGRSVVYVLDADDEAFTVDLDFFASNSGHGHEQKVRVHDPQGGIAAVYEKKFYSPPTDKESFRLSAAASNPYTVEGLSKYEKSYRLHIPQDGKSGAYAFEIITQDKDLSVSAVSSLGKVVHYIPLYSKRATALTPESLLDEHQSDLGSMCSAPNGGQAWFMPDGDETQLEIGFVASVEPYHQSLLTATTALKPVYRNDWQRVTVLGPTQHELGHTTITGMSADGISNPTGIPCKTIVTAPEELHSIVTYNINWDHKLFVKGALPFFSSTKEEWFNPTNVVHASELRFLTPGDNEDVVENCVLAD